MGAATRRPKLPAPTESSAFESAEEEQDFDTDLATDLATDLSRRTDRTSHTIPDDGSPITITTAPKTSKGKLSKLRNKSHTSLLIEYFEGGIEADGTRHPSVRVKVPSGSRKSGYGRDSLVVTEARGPRKASYSRHISLGTDSPGTNVERDRISSLAALEGRQRQGPPIEVEVLGKGGSEVSTFSQEARYIEPTSDISSMPADSLLGGTIPVAMAQPDRSRSLSHEDIVETETLKAPAQPYDTNPSTERLTQKVIEKLNNKPRTSTSGTRRRHGEKSRSRSASKEIVETEMRGSRRKSGKHREDLSLATESSLPSNSLLSANPRSLDQGSIRSGTSQGSSITNPRLLHTVEDAIRRLILPELNQLKKDQRKASSSRRYEKGFDPSDLSESSISREETSRHMSKYHTADDSPKIIRSSSKDAGEVLSSGHRRKSRRHKDASLDSPSERSYGRRESGDSISIEEGSPHKSRSKSHRTRDLAAAALAGGALTAAALKHHDSRSSVERRERRKKRSRSRSSRSASIAESEDVFHRHEVAPMPMRSDIDSEMTRSSLLTQTTADTATPVHQEVREVVRGSPKEISSPTSSTPTRTPAAEQTRGLGMHHSNFSDRNLGGHSEEVSRDFHETYNDNYPKWGTAGAVATGVAGGLVAEHILEDPERARAYEANLHHQHPIRRGLSPIQSVASYQTTEPNRNSLMHTRSIESFNSPEKRELRAEPSLDTVSSVNSIDLAKSKRPMGIHLENRSEVLAPHNEVFETSRDLDGDDDEFYEDQHSQNERYRDSYASSDPKVDYTRMTNYTDDSDPYLDKVTAGQQVARGYGANPEYVHTPPGVESAVASLYDPSLVDVRSNQSPNHSYSNSSGRQLYSPASLTRDLRARQSGSPLKQTLVAHSRESLSRENNVFEASPVKPLALSPQKRNFVNSPVQSIAKSIEERERNSIAANRSPALGVSHNPDLKEAPSPESEITTNPSIIRGPIGGMSKSNRDHWPYDATPPVTKQRFSPQVNRDLPAATAATGIGGLMGSGLVQSTEKPMDTYMGNQMISSSPGVKDEGYITGDNPRSPGLYADKSRGLDNFTPTHEPMEMPLPGDDPFSTKKGKYLSGFSQGMESPLYDSATGQGMDRIQSRDIVALMDHLTVRDAQRNARDTEMLVTLVRSAAEMRNSFDDLKKFIADNGDLIMDTADTQHEQTQKIIGGPRPQPPSVRVLQRSAHSDDSDLPTKRKNVFKRALQGLGAKNQVELQNIEAMLMQLLSEMDALRSTQQFQHHPSGTDQVQHSMNSAENIRAPTDPGYEPEGQAGTSSTGNRSGSFSNNSSRQDHYRGATGGLRESGNRVSTVMEGDEEYEDEAEYRDQRTPVQQFANGAPYRSPSQDIESVPRETARGVSEPLRTPPPMQQEHPQPGHYSNENTPQMSAGSGGKKHKSTTSSFFPRISRWSKTTASSITDNFRASGQQKPRPYSEVSHSGSQLDEYDYDPQGDDRLRSNTSFANDEQFRDQENRPPSPLIPSQVSDNPKYQAVRNSINLQHPQPRQGPTGRYQQHLETEAQQYGDDHLSPTSQTSSQWEQHGALNSVNPNVNASHAYAEERNLSPISGGGYSRTSSAMDETNANGRTRSYRSANSQDGRTPPLKGRDDEPLVPQRPPKVAMTPPNNQPRSYVDHVAAARAGSPALDKSPVGALRSPQTGVRKPSGPRPITTSGSTKGARGDLNTIKRTRFRGSPDHIDSSLEDVTY